MNRKLFLLLSVLTSLLTAALLRIVSCEIGFLAYYQNYLFACILFGLGIGLIDSGLARIKAPQSSWFACFVALLVLVAIGHLTVLPYMGGWSDGSTYFLNTRFLTPDLLNELTLTAIIFVVFSLTIRCCVPLGTALGARLTGLSLVGALGLFALGTVGGLAVYAVSVWLMCPPVVLVALIGAAALWIVGRKTVEIALVVLALAAAFSLNYFVAPVRESTSSAARSQHPGYSKDFWAPEGHVQTYPLLIEGQPCGFAICSNQYVADFSIDLQLDDGACRRLAKAHDGLKGYTGKYFKTPYIAKKNPSRVLILAAGSGNEAAEALLNGATEVHAVDWRPWMFELGKGHPQKPFASPAVRMIVGDPRQFLKESTEKYDLIIFGRLESQRSFSAIGLIRTDNFAYTLESFLDARDNLNSGGLIALSCSLYRNWYGLRLTHNLKLGMAKVDAILELPFRSYMFASSEKDSSLDMLMHENYRPVEILSVKEAIKHAEDVRPTFDDWPFLYASRGNLPVTNLVCLVLLMVAMLMQGRGLLVLGNGATTKDLLPANLFTRQNCKVLLVAAAYMVAAGKLVMTLAFNFGTTWQIAFAGATVVLGCVCVPAALARLVRLPAALLWVLAFVAYGLDFTFNYESVAFMANPALKFLAAAVLPTMPALFAACLLVQNLRDESPSPSLTMGMLALGLVFGLFAEHACVYSAISELPIAAITLSIIAILIRPRKTPIPAEVQLEKPLA